MKNSKSFAVLAATTAMTLALFGCNKSQQETSANPAASTEVGNVSDIDVTEHVKTALQQNDALKGFNIQVVTRKGDVRLIGVLDKQEQIEEAVKIARASDGAHTVHNELTIKK